MNDALVEAAKAVALHRPLGKQFSRIPRPLMEALIDAIVLRPRATSASSHTHSFEEDISKSVVGGEGGLTLRCKCGARLWEPTTPALSPHDRGAT